MVESSELIGDNKSVICTVLCNVKITTEEDAAPIVEAIQNMGDMVTLNLDGISLGVDGALAISRVLPPTLKG
jgi:Ran GTPase-activating protein (RanGAP) involved in mRNA processing and transport